MEAIRAFSFYADGELFAVDVTAVQKLVRNMEISRVPTSPPEVAGIANLKGRVIAVLSVPALLGRQPPAGRSPGLRNAVVFKPDPGGDQMGFAMDAPGRLIEIEAARIAPPPAPDGESAESCISGLFEQDGLLYRILDLDSIKGRYAEGGISRATAAGRGA